MRGLSYSLQSLFHTIYCQYMSTSTIKTERRFFGMELVIAWRLALHWSTRWRYFVIVFPSCFFIIIIFKYIYYFLPPPFTYQDIFLLKHEFSCFGSLFSPLDAMGLWERVSEQLCGA